MERRRFLQYCAQPANEEADEFGGFKFISATGPIPVKIIHAM